MYIYDKHSDLMLKNTQNTQILNTLISLYDLGSRPSYKSPKIAKKKTNHSIAICYFFWNRYSI